MSMWENPECLISLQGAAIDRILGEIVHSKSMVTPIDYVLCIGHFLGKVKILLVGWLIINQDKYVFFFFKTNSRCQLTRVKCL